jgi:putative nucleotidyltransferase with HDIG domain
LLLNDLCEDEEHELLLCKEGYRSAILVPLKVKDELIAVFGAGSYKPRKFGKDDLRRLSALAGETAIAIHNAQLFAQLDKLYIDAIRALITAIEAKDHYTRGHSEQVTGYAIAVADKLGLSRDEKELLKTSGLLHDIGKIGIDDGILLKAGGLNSEEWEAVKKHPSVGAQILGSGETLREAIPIVLHHHEHYDGSGYPVGLRGDNIPLGSRIIAVADAFEAMTSDRPYREALGFEQAIGELEKNAGSQFDPRIVKTFIDLIKSGNLAKGLKRSRKGLKAKVHA